MLSGYDIGLNDLFRFRFFRYFDGWFLQKKMILNRCDMAEGSGKSYSLYWCFGCWWLDLIESTYRTADTTFSARVYVHSPLCGLRFILAALKCLKMSGKFLLVFQWILLEKVTPILTDFLAACSRSMRSFSSLILFCSAVRFWSSSDAVLAKFSNLARRLDGFAPPWIV